MGKDDLCGASCNINNLAGTFFAGTSPLLRPFLERLGELLPAERQGVNKGYIVGSLRTHVNSLFANQESISVEADGKVVEIKRSELDEMIAAKYPSFQHQSLNLPGLLFIQSGPALHAASIAKLREMHGIRIPDGRRTQRYFFHTTVVSLQADQERIRIELDLARLPNNPHQAE
ncbi:MAG: hypothetical protein GKC10_04900 [Methanosarcinales archaeon]|nr:hypothetical protein [Methanosarcinales archaeon]